jgi:hypothetical protein
MPKRLNQKGFIPMIIGLVLLLLAAIFFAYLRVRAHQQR